MSSFYGIWHRDSKPVDKEEARKISEAFGWWGPDGQDYVVEGPLFIGQATLWNTPESKHEHLPLRKDGCILVADARIDNRDELARELDLPDRPLRKIGDSEFILAAYKKWGEDCADRLIGDFAFAIWDEKKQELFCARDFIGVKPLYYTVENNIFFFTNDLKALSKLLKNQSIDEDAIANYIANDLLTDHERTFFKQIKKLPSAHTLTVRKRSFSFRKYWSPRKIAQSRFTSFDDAAAALRKLLERCIDDRIRSDYRLSAHLSGGLDSSSIASLTARKLKQKGAKKPLLSFNWLHPEMEEIAKEHYEWNNSLEIAEKEGIELHFVDLKSDEMLSLMKNRFILYDSTRLWYEYPIRRAVRDSRSRVILSGFGGDDFITNHGHPYLTDLLLHGKFDILFSELNTLVQKHPNRKVRALLRILYFKFFVPAMPSTWYCTFPKISCLRSVDESFIQPGLRAKVRAAYKKRNYVFERYNTLTIRKDLLRSFYEGHIQGRLESWHNAALAHRLEYRYPLLDRRIVEFALRLPAEYFVHQATRRYLYRRAVKDTMPSHMVWGHYKFEKNRVDKLHCLYNELIKKEVFKEGSTQFVSAKFFESIKELRAGEPFPLSLFSLLFLMKDTHD